MEDPNLATIFFAKVGFIATTFAKVGSSFRWELCSVGYLADRAVDVKWGLIWQ